MITSIPGSIGSLYRIIGEDNGGAGWEGAQRILELIDPLGSGRIGWECRRHVQHVGPTAKCWHILPKCPCRGDTKSRHNIFVLVIADILQTLTQEHRKTHTQEHSQITAMTIGQEWPEQIRPHATQLGGRPHAFILQQWPHAS